MTFNAVVRRKIDATRVSVSSYPKLSVLAASHARLAAESIRNLLNTLADVKPEASAVVRCGRYLRRLPAPSVLGVLEVDGAPNSALLYLDSALVSHVIDVSLGGDPTVDSAFTDRMPTEIDFALCRRFADRVLQCFGEAVAVTCRSRSIGRLTCGRFENSPQMVAVAPDKSEVLIINQRVEIGDGARAGFFELVLPLSVIDPIKGDLMQHHGTPSALNAQLWDSHFRRSLLNAQIELDVVIESQKVPLKQLSTMKPGDVLPLGRSAVDEVELMLRTRGGERSLATCRLGAKGLQKAVKLLGEPDEALMRELRLDGAPTPEAPRAPETA
jgi:flagellar motor switch protein FliM